MTTEKHLELIIPASLWPNADTREAIWRDLTLPALAQLYGKARVTRGQGSGLYEALAQRLGCELPPIAPLLLSKNDTQYEPGYWLCVDPVTLRVDRDHLTVLGEPYLQVSQQEADALIVALNNLYRDDGYFFVAPHAQRWFVRMPHSPNLAFTPLKNALAKDLNTVLPVGEGALKFNALLNEMQMLLYAHPVNDVRDANGLPLINSLWLWGGGEYPAPAQATAPSSRRVYGGDAVVQALAAQSAAPTAVHRYADVSDPNALVVLDELETHAVYGAGYEWQQVWLRWEAEWFAPVLAALKSGELARVTLNFSDVGEICELTRADLWRFWRKAGLPRHLNFQA